MHWSWHGLAAVILATALGGGYAAVLVIAALHHGPLSADTTGLLTNLGGILAGALAGYLGGHAAGRSSHHRDDDKTD